VLKHSEEACFMMQGVKSLKIFKNIFRKFLKLYFNDKNISSSKVLRKIKVFIPCTNLSFKNNGRTCKFEGDSILTKKATLTNTFSTN
jgi:hypothetical protein